MGVADAVSALVGNAVEGYEDILTDTCTIQRYTKGSRGEWGSKPEKWNLTWATGVACRYDEMSGLELAVGEEMVRIDGLVFFLVAQDITEKDRVTTIVRSGVTIVDRLCGVKFVHVPGGVSHHKEVGLAFIRTN